MEIEKTKHLCMLPWTQASLSQDGEFTVCCHARPSLGTQKLARMTIDEARNSAAIREMRLAMLRGEPSSHCDYCYRMEATGALSSRERANRFFADQTDLLARTAEDGRIDTPLKSLDVRFSNTCNLRCRSCGPHSSTSWVAEATALGQEVPSQSLQLLKSAPATRQAILAALPEIKTIYFAGGEPLLEAEHYDLLEKLLELGRDDVILDYNSNFTHLKCGAREILPLWKRFQTVQVGASLDGAGRPFEYLRKGARWAGILENHRRVRTETPHVRIYVHPTISAMNVFHLPEAIAEWLREGIIQWPDQLVINYVRTPEHLALRILNEDERERLTAHYRAFRAAIPPTTHLLVRGAIEHALSAVLEQLRLQPFREDGPVLRARFRDATRRLDELRGESFAEIFPELASLLA